MQYVKGYKIWFFIPVTIMIIILFTHHAYGVRIKDIASVEGVRQNQLIGYGLVVGLNGTGDKDGTEFTLQSLVNMLRNMNIIVSPEDVKVKNVAAVIVTAILPPFVKVGSHIDVTISSLGDASSLQGGTLLLTPLKGSDGFVYAVAQGPLSIGGFAVKGAAGGGVQKNHPTVGRIAGGATVERELSYDFSSSDVLFINLHNPDFTTVSRVTQVINTSLGEELSNPTDAGRVRVQIPERYREKMISLISTIEGLEVEPDVLAKVILNERTGTVVIGENVRLKTVAVSHGNLTIEIREKKIVSQPFPFSPVPSQGSQPGVVSPEAGISTVPGGQTVVTPDTTIKVEEEQSRLLVVQEGISIGEVVKALNTIGVTPRDLIAILQAIRSAGALQAELEII
ncbi:MAG: flagellar basal body P-ring protein FlgI [Thermodesulfobacteriota bacterium]|nr:flagellar basal body P-ring protein FlgI [Thermodesulfobacteriota bacterium]